MNAKLLTFLFLCLALTVGAQNTFTLSGTAHPEATTVELAPLGGPSGSAQTINVTNGHFTATGTISSQTLYSVLDRAHRQYTVFIADAPAISVNLLTDENSGSELNKELSTQLHLLSQMEDETMMNAFILSTIKKNKDNVVGAFFLSEGAYSLTYDELKQIFSEDNVTTRHPLSRTARRVMEGLAKRQPGMKFTDLEEADPDGTLHHLSEYVGRGQYVLVDFWASWCGPCRQEMPNVVAAYEKYHPKGFQIVGLSFDQSHSAWVKAIESLHMPWTHLSDLKGWKTVASETYGIHSIPASILFSPDGTIVATDLRGAALSRKLAEIYGE